MAGGCVLGTMGGINNYLVLSIDIHPLSPEGWSWPLMGIVSGRYRYLQDLLQLEATAPVIPSCMWHRGPTPIAIESLAHHLRSHTDADFAGYVLRGLTADFRVGYAYSTHRLRSRNRNHPSSLANQAVVSRHIATELAAGRLIGPLPQALHDFVHTSPIGLVPKGHNTGKWRMIVDLSSPDSTSVNNGVSEDLCSLCYPSIDDALRLICHLGPGTQLVKMDLRDAYRMVPVHPNDQHLLAVTWDGAVCWQSHGMDQSLPFGLRSAPKIFTAVADAMAWALSSRGICFILHYLDDFLFIGPPGSHDATMAREIAEAVFGELGVPIAAHKTEGPAVQVSFLGFIVDTSTFQLRLPEDKLARLKELIQTWRRRRNCTRREMESLLGHLCHAAMAVRPGRLFLRQLFALLPSAPKPYHHIRLNFSVRADLAWWLFFMQEWNGVALFPPGPPSVHVYSDASGSFGCGAVVSNGAWFNAQWPPSWSSVNIAVKELVPVVLAAVLWGPLWRGQHILFHIDNMAVVQVVRNLNASDCCLGQLLRCLYFYAAHFQFSFSAAHIPGVQNTAADALSHGDLPHFYSLFPQVPRHTIPPTLVNLFLAQTPDWNSTTWMTLFRASLLPASPPLH